MANHIGLAEIMPVIDHALAAQHGDAGRLQDVRHAQQRRAGVHTAMAEHNQRILGVAQQGGGPLDQLRIGLRRREGGQGREQLHLFLQAHDVRRHLQGHWTRTPGAHLLKGPVDQARRGGGLFHPFRPLRQVAQHAQLIRDLVQKADALVYPRRRDLPSQAQHPLIAGVGGAQSGGGVQHPRPRDD